MIKLRAEVQSPLICLNRTQITYPTIYANKEYQIKSTRDPNAVVIQNLGNIPAEFNWEDLNNQDVILTQIEPASGLIEAKSEKLIKFRFKAKLYGKFQFIFRCNVSCLEYPLSFKIDANIFGLKVGYYVAPEVEEMSLVKKRILKRKRKQGLLGDGGSVAGSQTISEMGRSSSQAMYDAKSLEELKNLNFLDLEINEPHTYKILIQNHSGIRTTFRIASEKYGESPQENSNTPAYPENSLSRSQGGNSNFKRSFSKAFTITSE